MRNKNAYRLSKAKYLLDEEFNHLNNTLEKFKITDERNCTLLWLAIHTGARATEVLNVTAEDLDPHEMTVLIKGIKGSDDRDIPLPKWLFLRVKALAPVSGRVFPITYIRFHQIWQLYRPCKKKLHSLRHTFAINLYRKTKDVRLIQLTLGHRNLDNTMIYADYQFKTSELRRAILG